MEINRSTSKFNRNDISKLKVVFKDLTTFDVNDVNEDISFLMINNYDKDRVFKSNRELDKIGNSLCNYIKDILDNETVTRGTDGSNTCDFVAFLLRSIDLDSDPFKIKRQAKYIFSVNSIINEENDDPVVSSKPDFSIVKGNNILMIDEDKHHKRSGVLDKGEYQIAGEMIAAGYENMLKYKFGKRKCDFATTIYASMVIGTRFTFYKTTITDTYLNEVAEGTISEGITIYKFAESLEYCDPKDRVMIIKILLKLKKNIHE
ncbi:hypothetical protein CONCODRAFT_169123 [Conidiobolus coronatus NRRL 28638]|uniref:Fungal-type protein kinase domain-containing protein n=1 Tax=Conidiobolus coronatus (strain ATCC 28846 / CBS 209.66 / NRRL 28638) TaxID=796925 RepID=A0A137NSL2_CONC2|nr:hypothetical protein CONCODRAFT_169123 [Conidiobolus coronatus NRRL 28638]|eukprot:KXN65755.1 hypothetical protein CONCODRAFT_169123 [Conidiobolus coronatus NRRL 28638]